MGAKAYVRCPPWAAILAWASLATLASASAHAVERGVLPMAQDLVEVAREAQARRAPVLILFSASGCHYCDEVREGFLVPTTRNPDYDDKVVMVEVDAASEARLLDFDGRPTTHAAFAARMGVRMTPTVKLFDARGRELVAPLVGIVSSDFYGGFLEEAIQNALARVRERVTSASRALPNAGIP